MKKLKQLYVWFYQTKYRVLDELSGFRKFFVTYSPNSYWGNRMRVNYWKKVLRIKDLYYVGRGAELNLTRATNFYFGKHLTIGKYCILDVSDGYGIYIGDDVGIAARSYLRTANHKFDDLNIVIHEQGHFAKAISHAGSQYSIVIEDDVWIGAHAIILSGAHIGKGSVVSAGSVISSAIPPYSIFVGNPGRVIANRQTLAAHNIQKEKSS